MKQNWAVSALERNIQKQHGVIYFIFFQHVDFVNFGMFTYNIVGNCLKKIE